MVKPLEELFESSLGVSCLENSFTHLPPSRGILLITDKNRLPIQLLSVSNLRRIAVAKFSEQNKEDPVRKTDLRPIASCLYYTPVISEFHCMWLYHRLVHCLFPDKAEELISLPNPYCVQIDPSEAWACFSAGTNPCQHSSGIYFGPFPTRKAADSYAEVYNHLFGLCRNRRLALSGNGKKCSYYQMNFCPGPCLNRGMAGQYRQTVERAIKAADGSSQNLRDLVMIQMKNHAEKRQYEQAQFFKKQLDQIRQLEGRGYRWTRKLDTLKILHIAAGPKVPTFDNLRKKTSFFCSYLITSLGAEKVPNFSFTSLGKMPAALQSDVGRQLMVSVNPAEHLAMTSFFLYKSQPPGLWIDLNEYTDLNGESLKKIISDHFYPAAPENHKKRTPS